MQAGIVANYAVSNATLSTGAAAKAQRALDKGASKVAAGHTTDAIESYQQAWDIAVGRDGGEENGHKDN